MKKDEENDIEFELDRPPGGGSYNLDTFISSFPLFCRQQQAGGRKKKSKNSKRRKNKSKKRRKGKSKKRKKKTRRKRR